MLQKRQSETYMEMCACLEEHGLCCVERPTGFGKTKLFMDYANKHSDDKMLYIYDTNSARSDIESGYAPKNVEFLSYKALSLSARHDSIIRELYL